GFRIGRAHHARRELGLAGSLPSHERRVDVLHRHVYPHLPRLLLRLLQGAARALVDARRRHPADDDGDRLHGLCAALGADELLGLIVFSIVYAAFVFFSPNLLGDPANYIPANSLSTPEHIVPEWYFLPFYAILRSVPNKLFGVVMMFGSILILFMLPWLDTSK